MKKLIFIISFICFAAAALILIFMPKPEKTLPPLPEANYTYDIRGNEIISDGVRKIIKRPVLASDYENYSGVMAITTAENNDFERLCPSFEEDDAVTYMMNICEVKLASADYISYKCEGIFTNATTSESNFLIVSHSFDFKTGEEIFFTDVVANPAKFEKAFANGSFTRVKGDSYLSENSSSEMLGNYYPSTDIYPQWYIDGQYFYVIAEGPAALGGLTEYKIPLLEAEEFLNMEHALISLIFEGE